MARIIITFRPCKALSMSHITQRNMQNYHSERYPCKFTLCTPYNIIQVSPSFQKPTFSSHFLNNKKHHISHTTIKQSTYSFLWIKSPSLPISILWIQQQNATLIQEDSCATTTVKNGLSRSPFLCCSHRESWCHNNWGEWTLQVSFPVLLPLEMWQQDAMESSQLKEKVLLQKFCVCCWEFWCHNNCEEWTLQVSFPVLLPHAFWQQNATESSQLLLSFLLFPQMNCGNRVQHRTLICLFSGISFFQWFWCTSFVWQFSHCAVMPHSRFPVTRPFFWLIENCWCHFFLTPVFFCSDSVVLTQLFFCSDTIVLRIFLWVFFLCFWAPHSKFPLCVFLVLTCCSEWVSFAGGEFFVVMWWPKNFFNGAFAALSSHMETPWVIITVDFLQLVTLWPCKKSFNLVNAFLAIGMLCHWCALHTMWCSIHWLVKKVVKLFSSPLCCCDWDLTCLGLGQVGFSVSCSDGLFEWASLVHF